jgi:hypothetical protein
VRPSPLYKSPHLIPRNRPQSARARPLTTAANWELRRAIAGDSGHLETTCLAHLVRLIELLLLVRAPWLRTSPYLRYLPQLRPHGATPNSGQHSLQFQEAPLPDVVSIVFVSTSTSPSSPSSSWATTQSSCRSAPVPKPRRRWLLRRAETLGEPHLSDLLWSVRSRSNTPDQITYSNRYEQIWSIQSTLDPTSPIADPIEQVCANQNQPRGLPVFEPVFK